MPIECPFDLPRLNDDEMRAIDYEVMKYAFAAHSARGRFGDESVYRNDLAQRLIQNGIQAESEVPIKLSFRDFELKFRIDLLVSMKAIYEIKTVEKLNAKHEAQCLGYLFMTNATRSKLVNFRPTSVESRFVNTSRTTKERQQFDFHMSEYNGDLLLPEIVQELTQDWGTGLNASVYRKAILEVAGDETAGDHLLELIDAGRSLGNQKFHLLNKDTGLAVTTYSNTNISIQDDLRKLLAISPLSRLHWLNITHGHVRLSTVLK